MEQSIQFNLSDYLRALDANMIDAAQGFRGYFIRKERTQNESICDLIAFATGLVEGLGRSADVSSQFLTNEFFTTVGRKRRTKNMTLNVVMYLMVANGHSRSLYEQARVRAKLVGYYVNHVDRIAYKAIPADIAKHRGIYNLLEALARSEEDPLNPSDNDEPAEAGDDAGLENHVEVDGDSLDQHPEAPAEQQDIDDDTDAGADGPTPQLTPRPPSQPRVAKFKPNRDLAVNAGDYPERVLEGKVGTKFQALIERLPDENEFFIYKLVGISLLRAYPVT